MTCLTFNRLSLSYSNRSVIDDFSGEINKGDMVGVIGVNGSGKSTLMKGIAGLLKPSKGECLIQNKNSVAYLPQRSDINLNFPARVIDLVSLGLWRERHLLKRFCSHDRQKIESALTEVGLSEFEKAKLSTLSGGQLQRVLFARVIVQNCDLILLDEPFNSVDSNTINDLMALVCAWNKQGKTVLAVLHDIDLVKSYFPKTLFINHKKVLFDSTEMILNQGQVSNVIYG